MTSPLVIQLMRFAFLALLWLFVFAAVRVIASQLRSAGAPRVSVSPRPRKQRKALTVDSRSNRNGISKLMVTEGSLAGTQIAMTGKPILIGRANDSTLVLTDDYASTRHARISEINGVWYLEDLGSTNGTFLGQKKVDGPVPLNAGVAIRIGRTVLELR
jgi:hypothetical protein